MRPIGLPKGEAGYFVQTRKDLEALSPEDIYSLLIHKVKCSEKHIIKQIWVDKLKIDGKKFMTLTD